MRNLAVIGSTGSVGVQALDVIARHPDVFQVTALTAHSNVQLLCEQARRFSPKVVGVSDASCYQEARQIMPGLSILAGEEAHAMALEAEGTDTSLISVVGIAGLLPLIQSIERGFHTCVANKESIVCGGALVNALLQESGARIYPVDSEHSAIFQCLDGHQTQDVRRVLLTCSGGAFRDMTREQIENASVLDALQHPNWSMGKKITIDSATLANKGLEVLEARWLFNIPLDKIEVVIHPQSIVHSLVEWVDGSVMAQLGVPDMRLPIQYALGYPKRLDLAGAPLDLVHAGALTFAPPDTSRFPCLALAYEAGRAGGALPVAFNAANDAAVAAYAQGNIAFYDIPRWIERAMNAFCSAQADTLEEIMDLDRQVRRTLA